MPNTSANNCRCCFELLMKKVRVKTTKNIRDIFQNLIGSSMVPGAICGKCNMQLLAFDSFQKNIKRKHEAPSGSFENNIKSEEIVVEIDRKDFMFNEAEEKTASNDTQPSDDENDVCFVPQEPEEPIDVDSISDEPKPKKHIVTYFKCEHCTAVSSKREIIVKHIEQSHVFECESCGNRYPTHELLASHIMKAHQPTGAKKRKQDLKPINTANNAVFRMQAKPFGRPWPSVLAKTMNGNDF